jgi:hypothetical protein
MPNSGLKTRKRIVVYGVVLVAFARALFSSIAIAKTPEQVFTRVSPHVVAVEMIDAHDKHSASGSGVVMRQGTVVTTCDVRKGEGAACSPIG